MSDARGRIEAAYRRAMKRWELLPDSEAHLTEMLDRLTIIAATVANPPKPAPRIEQYRDVGRNSSRRELDKLAEAAETVIRCVDALHQPAILALAGRGMMRAPIVQSIRKLADEARAADVSGDPAVAGRTRPKNDLARGVAANVIGDFERLTGARADLPADAPVGGGRGLAPLVTQVFKAMGIKANAKAAIKAALAGAE